VVNLKIPASIFLSIAAVCVAGSVAHAQSGLNMPPPGAKAVAPQVATVSKPETVFVALDSCRIADTRKNTPIQSNTNRQFIVSGTAGFEIQGGTAGGCDIPPAATAVVLSIADFGSNADGRLTVWPTGTPKPPGINLTFQRGKDAAGVVTTRLGTAGQISVRSVSATSNVVLDTQGYFIPTISAIVNADGALARGSRIVSTARLGVGSYEVVTDRNVTTCFFTGTIGVPGAGASPAGQIDVAARSGVPNAVFVRTSDSTGVLSDRPFHLKVNCPVP